MSAPHSVPRRVLLASRNAKKLAELRRVVDASGIVGLDVVGLDAVPEYPEEPETGATFEENALIKARSGARATGLPCLADDSGLSVDALNGMPGVLSARWSGRHGDDAANNELLLNQIADVPDERRGAAFVSACALVMPDGTETVVRGEWRGTILREGLGANGFGYDPLFVPDDAAATGRTSAELSAQEKDSLSHRGKALVQLVPALAALAASD
ncbi:RdgB/HAM1 family non-canonical purine NTP pyrophosphatase [Gordonia sp. L191]|uniref:RdgB/HAM1 family non-canonical purine NTP pyrophosphatase n=1 Tax=Gordonia sp. L191 TaxID=2982699 RepID=UPI0024C07457|nr:RdgB/HAM1 family non-canonical purine NTP pyrophosphatase [Gordonia sp. L191]WHU45206.1 RdgB/HAM1 family non-canonical purine NTP pyrophosphatase [Gordonia sp. L191]